jgi:hypothetical protein
VQDDGSLEVHTDATLRVDQRQQLGVRNKFDTPTKDTQAANKAYVDDAIASIVTGSAWQSVSKLPEARTNLGGSAYVVVGQSSNFHYFGALTDLDNLAGVGPNGLQLATGYYWVLRQQVIVANESGGTRTVEVRLVQDQGGALVTLTSLETAIGNNAVRTINLETVSSGGDDVYLEVAALAGNNDGISIDSARLHAQLLELRNDPDIAGSLPPPLGITASFSAESLTAVAWTDDVAFLQTSVGDADTFTWTFDEWGPTYLDYSGAVGSLVSHRFMDGGTHTVELTASGPSGSDTATVDVVVQDVVETQNLLTTDAGAPADYTDFNNWGTTGTLSKTVTTSTIAAPDGTLTAQDIAVTGSGQWYVSVPHIHTGMPLNTVTFSWYIYTPTNTVAGRIYQAGAGAAEELIAWNHDSSGITSFSSVTAGSEPYSAEKNVYFEPVGDTGWVKISITRTQFIDTTIQYWRFDPVSGQTYTLWNPTLRYGDWVARGKNWLPTTDIIGSWLQGNLDDIQLSSEAAPDGTLSAVDVYPTVGSIGTVSFNQLTSAYGWPDDARYTWEFYIKHPLPVSSPTCYFNCTVDSTGGDEQWWPIIAQDGGFTGGIARNVTSGPGYSIADDAEAVAIGTDGWWRYRFSMQQFDTAATIFQIQTSIALRVGATGQKITIWNPRLTVGNPADARGYFVSGPQNLLGDGSDYTGGYWAKDASVTITANAQVAPNGRLEADDITRAVNADDFRAYAVNLGTVITGGLVRYTFYVKPPSGLGSPTEQIEFNLADYPYTGFKEAVYVYLDYSTPATPAVSSVTSITTGGPGYTVNDVAITPISNGWSRIDIDLFDYGSNAEVVYVRHFGRDTANSGSAYTVSYWGSEVTTITPKTPV